MPVGSPYKIAVSSLLFIQGGLDFWGSGTECGQVGGILRLKRVQMCREERTHLWRGLEKRIFRQGLLCLYTLFKLILIYLGLVWRKL